MVFHSRSVVRVGRQAGVNLINPTGLSSVATTQFASGISKQVPQLEGAINTVGSEASVTLDPAVQISKRIKAASVAAGEHTSLINDSLTRLTSGAGRFRQGIQVAASTTHFSGAAAHGVTDPGQDVGISGGPMQLVEMVLGQMSQLGSNAVQSQAGHLPGM
jgi:hypothetical protein